jgi:hypothetical protein
MAIALTSVRLIPSQLVSGSLDVASARMASTAIYGASRKKLIATPFWARLSAVSERARRPQNRQMMMTLASPLDRAVDTEADQCDRVCEHSCRHGDNALRGHPREARPGQQLGPPNQPVAFARSEGFGRDGHGLGQALLAGG